MRWHYRDPLLVYLLPTAYVFHILEEWFGGFPEWLGLVAGAALPRPAFIVINAIALVLMTVAARAATAREENGWMAVAIAIILAINVGLHLLGSMMTQRYSPGLVTGIILYVPLASLVLIRASDQSTHTTFIRGVVAGVMLHALVIVIAFAATR